MDENFKSYTETFTGMTARIILHEYDHIDGKLFIDYLKPLRRKILQGKLNDISKGNTRVDYKMIQIK
jgi:peptide deformylase